MNAINLLEKLIVNKNIGFLGFYYPVISPFVKHKWTVVLPTQEPYQMPVAEYSSFSEACQKMILELKNIPYANEGFDVYQEPNSLYKIVDEIIFTIDNALSEHPENLWLFSLEYNNEFDDDQNAIWISVLEGGVYLDMQIEDRDKDLEKMCKIITSQVKKYI